MANLTVDPSYLQGLATTQQDAAGDIASATDKAKNQGSNLYWDHGSVCGYTANKLAQLKIARLNAGNLTQQVSEALAANLNASASAYEGVDTQNSDNLSQQVLPG